MMATTLNDDFPPLTDQETAAFIQRSLAGLAKLRVPFPEHQISKLPKGTKAQNDCLASEKVNCKICGGWHHPKIIHLDYVGHAALTDRLLDCDPNWSWEPLALGQNGLPVLDGNGGMWIRLVVCGVSRLGYGDAQGKTGGNAIKECIGDALRNAAMRFGAALDLWHKGDLHIEESPVPEKQESFKSVAKSEWDSLDAETQEGMVNEAMAVTVMLSKDDIEGAYIHLESLGYDDTERTAFDTRLDSQQRAKLKNYSTIIHADTLGSLITTWEAVPKYAKPLLESAKNKRKSELTEPEKVEA
jgi:hypothetical protein